jgi:hypothetical protein
VDVGVLTVVAAILVVTSLVAWYRVATRRNQFDGHGFRMVAAGLVSILALTAGYFEVAHHQRQQLATEALGVLSDAPGAKADCERLSEELFNASQFQGFVYYDDSKVAHLRREVCHDLWSYAHGGQAHPTRGQIVAVHIVAHETMHINGIRSESVAECRAVQLNHLVAEALGATSEEARALQRRYFVDIYPHQRDDYVSGECAEGGELDLYPDRTEFP